MTVSSDTKPTEDLEKAIYSRLYNTTDLIAILQSYAIYNTIASQFHPDDYVVFDGPVGGGDENLDSGNRRNVLYFHKSAFLIVIVFSSLIVTSFHFIYLQSFSKSLFNIRLSILRRPN